MEFFFVTQVIFLALSYLGLGLGFVPFLRMNRATIAFVGSGFMIGLGVITLEQGWSAIDFNTIIFLLSMMVINSYLSFSGFFNLVIFHLLKLSLSPFALIIVLTFATAFLSALFLNDTLVLVTTPIVLRLTSSLGLNPIPYLLAIAAATNIGSLPTLNGNPQNILVGSFSGISYVEFTQTLAPSAIVGLCLQIGWLWWLYPEIRPQTTQKILTLKDFSLKIHKPLLIKTLTVTGLMLVAFVVGLPLASTAFICASLLLITRRLKPEKVLGEINWSLLLMFSGLFILTRSVQALNLLDFFLPFVNQPIGLVFVTAILSNLISHI